MYDKEQTNVRQIHIAIEFVKINIAFVAISRCRVYCAYVSCRY